jgi:(R)-amidase
MSSINIALAQLACEDGDIQTNLARLDEVVNEYGDAHDLIIFPESFIVGFNTRETAQRLAEPLNGRIVKHLEAKAREANTTIAVGLYELDGENVYNTTVLVSASYGLVLAYRKTHLWLEEAQMVDAGDRYYSCEWNNIRAGLLICYDVEFPETSRAIASMGTGLLILTDGNMEPYGSVHRVAIQARAQENQMFVAMTNRVGKLTSGVFEGDTHFVGESAVVDPFGRIVAEAGGGEQILSVSIDLNLISESKRHYDYMKERRITMGTVLEDRENGIKEVKIV